MASGNAAATLERANDFSTDFATASLVIKAGATTLATHTLTGFVSSNSGANGLLTASAIADATIAATGTADGATLTAGTKVYTLTVGTTGTDVVVNSTSYVSCGTSTINSLAVTFPA